MTFGPAEAGLLVLRPPQLAASLSSENFEMMTAQDRIVIYGPKLKATQPNLKRPLSLTLLWQIIHAAVLCRSTFGSTGIAEMAVEG